MEPVWGDKAHDCLLSPLTGQAREVALQILHDQLEAMYWKKPHFKGLKKETLTRPRCDDLKRLVTLRWLSDLLVPQGDPLDELLRLVADACAVDQSCLEQWQRVETTLTTRLGLACALWGPARTGAAFLHILPSEALASELRIACMDWSKANYIQPDLVLIGGTALLLIEMKTRGLRTAHQFTASQYVKYLAFTATARRDFDELHVVLLVLAPRGGRPAIDLTEPWIRADLERENVLLPDQSVLEKELAKWHQRSDGSSVTRDQLLDEMSKIPVYFHRYDGLVRALESMPVFEDTVSVRNQLERLIALSEPGHPSR